MLSKSLLASLIALASVSNALHQTPPSTTCTTIGTGNRHTRSYTRASSCTNTVPKARTVHTTTTTTPVSTSTVVVTETDTADTSTSTATQTNTETDTTSVTNTETVTSTASATTIVTVTSSYGTGAPTDVPEKRDVQRIEERAALVSSRPPPPAGVVCVVNRCVRTRLTTTVTSTTALPLSTTTTTSTQTTVVTPNASTTVTTNTTITSTSSFTDTSTQTITQTSTGTTTVTATPTFYIVSSQNPNIADGTNLTNVPDRQQGEGQGQFVGSGTLFTLDPDSGALYDTNLMQFANADSGSNSIVYFDTAALILDASYPQCNCNIDGSLNLNCNCAGNSLFQTNGNYLAIASGSGQRGLVAEQPVVQIVDQK